MDWKLAVERNREALKRVLVTIFTMAGFVEGKSADTRATLPRHFYNSVLRRLRPAETAVRRLIIVAARELTITLQPRAAALAPAQYFSPFGKSGPVMTPKVRAPYAAPTRLVLPIADPLPRFGLRRHYVSPHNMPRIWSPGMAEAPRPKPPTPDDPVNTHRLDLRLAALAHALDDLPREALRFARWKARQQEINARRDNPARATPRHRQRLSPLRAIYSLRVGRKSLRRRDELNELVVELHGLARETLQRPDTS